tara:strand:- start:78 stop:632 length:555 start_codon:yes stop_codon:yes gene_type:complete
MSEVNITQKHNIVFYLRSNPDFYDIYDYLEDNWEEVELSVNDNDTGGLKTSLKDLGITESQISPQKLIETLINNCEPVPDENGNDQFKYPLFGKWIVDHYDAAQGYYGSDEYGLETCFDALKLTLFVTDSSIVENDRYKIVYKSDDCELLKMDKSHFKFKPKILIDGVITGNSSILGEYILHAT